MVNMGTAETYLSDDLLLEKLKKEEGDWEPWMLHYYSYPGVPKLLHAAAAFINHFFQPVEPVLPNQVSSAAQCTLSAQAGRIGDVFQVVSMLGTCSTFDILAHVLAEPGGFG